MGMTVLRAPGSTAKRSSRQSADVVVLNVIATELEATLEAFDFNIGQKRKLSSGTLVWTGSLRSSVAQQEFGVAVGCVARAGNPDTAEIAGELIRRFRPRLVLLVGIAAGIRGRARIGDVVLSSTVFGYEPSALVRRGGRRVAVPRPVSTPLPHAINQELAAYLAMARKVAPRGGTQGPITAPPGLETEYAEHVAEKTAIIEGVIASGEKLLRDATFLTELRTRGHGRIEAGDMESAGLVTACTKAGTPWLVVRGISDFGDDLKDDRFHLLASRSAAAVAADFLENCWQPVEPRNTSEAPVGSMRPPRDADRQLTAAPQHNLPGPDFEAFIGRADKIEEIVRRLLPYPKSQYSLVCIDGAGGIGKSALAIRTAYNYIETYHETPEDERFDNIIWTSGKVSYLHPSGIRSRPRSSRTLEEILRSICVFFEREDLISKANEHRIDEIYKLLARKRTLLIIDNLETMIDDSVEAFIKEVVAPTKVLMTSRQRVEMAYPVRLDGLNLEEARQLISRHAEYRLVEVDEKEIVAIHAATGGVPLAIYWALGLRILGEPTLKIIEKLRSHDTDLARFCFDEVVQKIHATPSYSAFVALACAPNHANVKGIASTASISETDCEAALGNLEFLSLARKMHDASQLGGRRFSMPTLARMYAFGQLDVNPIERQKYFRGWIEFLKEPLI